MRSVYFMLVITFDWFLMSKTKLKVAHYWIKDDIMKQLAENIQKIFISKTAG